LELNDLLRVVLYSRENCKLCDQAKEDLAALSEDISHELVIVDISSDPVLLAEYDTRIPVIEAGPYKLEAPFDETKLRMTLGAARDTARQKQEFGGEAQRAREKRSQSISQADRISYWFSRRYLFALNLFLFLYVGLSFLAPVLMKASMPGLARPIYFAYGAVCHQLAFRSWFLFGDQPAYPREAAGVAEIVPFGQATGGSEEDLLAARSYIGDEGIGYKVAFCERDVAIYAAMFMFGLLYAISKRKIPALPWYMWFLIGIFPIALDGFSQLLSQLPGFSLWDYRESTPFLRSLTGALFGFTTAWFGFPVMEETMSETRLLLAGKFARLNSGD